MKQKLETGIENPEKERDAAAQASKLDISQKTTGEKYYGRLKFATGEVFILAATAAIAYWARYGKAAYKGVPNYLKRLQDWIEDDLFVKKIPIKHKGDVGAVLTGAFASMFVTGWGGNFFAAPMKWFENSKKRMVDYFNRRHGNPGELEAGHERLKDEPQQSWGDVIKSRVAAYALVFVSFIGAYFAAGKDKTIGNNGVFRFDKYEDWVGKKLAGFTKEGEAISKLSVLDRLDKNKPHLTNKTYKFGRILALDIYATTAVLIIWGALSKVFANKRKQKDHPALEMTPVQVQTPSSSNAEKPQCAFSNSIQPCEAKAKVAAKAKGEGSYADMVARQEMDQTTAVGVTP